MGGKRRFLGGLALAALLGSHVSCNSATPEDVSRDNRLVATFRSEPDSYNRLVSATSPVEGIRLLTHDTLVRIARERLGRHRDLDAVATALREVPRSLPFEGLAELAALEVPALVVASHDEADPGHPHAIASAWSSALPRASLISEEPGESPLAWQGGRLSREIAAFCTGLG